MDEGSHRRGRRHRKQHDPPVVQRRRELVRAPDQERYHDEPDGPNAVEQDAPPAGEVGAETAARPHHGQSGTDQEAEGAGVGALVHPRRVYTGLVDQPHGGGGERRAGQGQAGQDRTGHDRATAGESQDDKEKPGPDQVELLLHRQRPQVIQRGGGPKRAK